MIVCGPSGLNIPPVLALRLGMVTTPQRISVDGVHHEIGEVRIEQIEEWFKTAKVFPYVLGSSAAEFIASLTPILKRERDILIVTGSRKIVSSYDAAVSAARTVKDSAALKNAYVRVVDSGLADLGGGLVAIRCAAAAQQGAAPSVVLDEAHRLSAAACQLMIPATLEIAKRNGRMASLKAMAANLLNILPVLRLVDGEVKSAGTMPVGGDVVATFAEHFETHVPLGKPVWLGVTHGNALSLAEDVAKKLQSMYDVRHTIVRVSGPAMYAGSGRGCIGATVLPVDDAKLKVTPP